MNIGKYVQMYSDDLRLKNYAKSTIENYSSQVKLFLEYFNDSATKPSEISERKIKDWLLLANTVNSRKHRISALKLFYSLTGKQPLKLKHIEYPRAAKPLPRVIDWSELETKFERIRNTKHRAILETACRCALRVSEVCNLKLTDVDTEAMFLFIRNAKGGKDRYVPMSDHLLNLLMVYCEEYDPKEYLFEGQKGGKYSTSSCENIFKGYIDKNKSFHTCRHSGATQMLNNNTHIRVIQNILGHKSSRTTEIYTHVSKRSLVDAAL